MPVALAGAVPLAVLFLLLTMVFLFWVKRKRGLHAWTFLLELERNRLSFTEASLGGNDSSLSHFWVGLRSEICAGFSKKAVWRQPQRLSSLCSGQQDSGGNSGWVGSRPLTPQPLLRSVVCEFFLVFFPLRSCHFLSTDTDCSERPGRGGRSDDLARPRNPGDEEHQTPGLPLRLLLRVDHLRLLHERQQKPP